MESPFILPECCLLWVCQWFLFCARWVQSKLLTLVPCDPYNFPSTPRSPRWHLPRSFHNCCFVRIFICPRHTTFFIKFILLQLITLIIFREDKVTWSSERYMYTHEFTITTTTTTISTTAVATTTPVAATRRMTVVLGTVIVITRYSLATSTFVSFFVQ
jgi:hypothetical protein